MVRWMLELLYLIVWGKRWRRRGRHVDDTVVTSIGSERAKPIRYGRMVLQVFLNRKQDGTLNPKYRLKREVGKDRNSLSENFYFEDLDDGVRCLVRARAWTADLLEIE